MYGTDPYVVILTELTRMLHYQSDRPVCGNINQTNPYVAISIQLTLCGNINQTYPYLAISIKLTLCGNINLCGNIIQTDLYVAI